MVKIRIAAPSDRKGINQITKEFNRHDYSHAPSYFDQAIAAKKIFVAILAGKVVGYLTFHVIWGNTPFIELLRVSEKYQKKGIGRLILAQLEKKLRRQSYSVLLSSSEEVNEVGNVFHKQMEFRPIGSLKMIYGTENFYKKSL
ncbi:GNAT family N-acetyltransferase [Candidatus Gottesmanbacteria bacterium]|nr:GNAT family N-acetyltransferase [Candidatus Gottesmanbacteria bacterium]